MTGEEKKLQPNLSFDELYKQAGESRPMLRQDAENFLKKLQAENPGKFDGVRFELGPLKTRDRALAKVNGEYFGDARKIQDLVRGRFVVSNPDQIAPLKQAFEKEFKVMNASDRFADPLPNGYRDINSKVELANGHKAELQIQTDPMIQAGKDATHDLWEKHQDISRKIIKEGRPPTDHERAAMREIRDQALDIHNAASHDAGINPLLSEEAKASEKFIYKGALDGEGKALGRALEEAKMAGKDGGPLLTVVIAGGVGVATLIGGGTKAEATENMYGAAVPYGEAQILTAKGDTQGAKRSATIETGGYGGMATGALAGGAIGSVVPVIGTGVGAVVGGIAGGIGGAKATEVIYDHAGQIKDAAKRGAQYAGEAAGEAWSETKEFFGADDDGKPAAEAGHLTLTANAAFAGLPDKVSDNMPPEVSALVQLKKSPELFIKEFEELNEQGSLPEVEKYMRDNPRPEAPMSLPSLNLDGANPPANFTGPKRMAF